MDLTSLREQIDAVDRELTALFLRRMALSDKIAAVKAAEGLPILQPERERQVLGAVCGQTPEALRPAVARLYGTIFALSRERQEER